MAEWEVLAGPQADRLQPVGSVHRKGFETAIVVETTEPYVGIRARTSAGEVLGMMRTIEVDRR